MRNPRSMHGSDPKEAEGGEEEEEEEEENCLHVVDWATQEVSAAATCDMRGRSNFL